MERLQWRIPPAGRRVPCRRRIAVYRWLGWIEDVVLGRECALCGDRLYMHRYRPSQVCRACTARIYRARLDERLARCSVCGRLLLREQGRCTSCRKLEHEPAFDSHSASLEYQAGGEELIGAFKMRRRRAVVRLAASLVAQGILRCDRALSGAAGGGEFAEAVCVPVPPGSRSAKRRDFQPVYLLAREVARKRRMPVARLLERTGRGLDQKKLGREERSRNVAGKFSFRRDMPVPAVVWLIDDVYTTGATVSECARVLKEAGVGEVHVRTVAMD